MAPSWYNIPLRHPVYQIEKKQPRVIKEFSVGLIGIPHLWHQQTLGEKESWQLNN